MADEFGACDAVIVLLAMPGCPACEEFKPRFERMVDSFRRHGVPFVYFDGHTSPSSGQIPVIIADATSPDESIQGFCDSNKIEGMPTTTLLRRGYDMVKLEGAVSDQELYELLAKAATSR